MSINRELLDELGIPGEARFDPRERVDPRDRVDLQEVSEDERIPMGENRLKMTLPKMPGYHMRWFNDVGDRIEKAKQAGYTHILKAGVKVGNGPESGHTDLGSVVSRPVGVQSDGTPLRAYGMKIKEEWYNEDQARKSRAIKETEAQILRGNLPGNEGDTSNRYVPEEGIEIE